MAKKPRSDSKLENLPDHQWTELRDQLLGGCKYEDALSWLLDECEVSSSAGAISNFYKNNCVPVLKDRRKLAAMKAEAVIDEAGRTDWDTAIIENLKQMAFELMCDTNHEISDVEKMLKLVLKDKDQDIKSRRVKILEDKVRKADEAKAAIEAGINQGGMSEETLAAMEGALKMLS